MPPERSGRGAALWIVLSLSAVLLLVIGLVVWWLVSPGDSEAEPQPVGNPTPTETEDPEPTETEDPEPTETEEPEPTETEDPEPADPPAGADGQLPPIATADSLPAADAEALGTVLQIGASSLRYNEMEVFGTQIYQCLVSFEIINLTDRVQAYELTMRPQQVPEVTWSSDQARELPAGDSSQLVIGWESETPDELEPSEAECQGELELAALSVDPG